MGKIAVGGNRTSGANPGIAAVLSVVVPGIGQFYTGHFVWGIIWLLFTPGFWLGTGGLLGWVCHILSAWQAYNQAERQ